MKKKIRKGMKIALAASILVFIFLQSNPAKIYAEITGTRASYYLLASAVFLSTLVAAGKRWNNLSGSLGENLSLWESFRLITVSYGFNLALPGNSGDLIRSKIQKRYIKVENETKILGAVAAERFMDFVGLTIVGSLSLSLISTLPKIASYLVSLMALVTFASGTLFYLKPVAVKKVVDLLNITGSKKVESFVSNVLAGVKESSKEKRIENFALTLYIWMGEALAFYLLIKSLSLDIGLWEGSLITTLMTFGSAVPATPAGLGIVEAIGSGLGTAAGASVSAAVSLVILQRSLSILQVGAVSFIIYNLEELKVIGK